MDTFFIIKKPLKPGIEGKFEGLKISWNGKYRLNQLYKANFIKL